MGQLQTQKYVVIFKDSEQYLICNYSGQTINQLEEDKKRFKEKFEAEFIYKGKIKNTNQALAIKLTIEKANKNNANINIKKLESIVTSEDN